MATEELRTVSSLSPPQAAIGGGANDLSSFYKSMERNIGRSLTHQRSMIEVPQGIFDLKNEIADMTDHEDNEISQYDEDEEASNIETTERKDDESESDVDEDEEFDEKDPQMQAAIRKDNDSSSDEDENEHTVDKDTDDEFSHSRDRSAAKIEIPKIPPQTSESNNNENDNDVPPDLARKKSPYADKRASEIEVPTSPDSSGSSPMRKFKNRAVPDNINLAKKNQLQTIQSSEQNEIESNSNSNLNLNSNDTELVTNGTYIGNNANGTNINNNKDITTNENGNDSNNNSENNNDNSIDIKQNSIPLKKELTPSMDASIHTNSPSINEDMIDEKLKSDNPRRSTKHGRHSTKQSRRSTRSIHRATIANDFDEEEKGSDDDFNTFKPNDNEPSLTMNLDVESWKSPTEGKFEECDLRFDEDDIQGGRKPPASDFRTLKLFFHFFYDRFHHNGTLLLETSLPSYQEWKASRKVKFRNNQIKKIDHCLKACNESVHSLRAMCYNCVLMCYDIGQQMIVNYPGCQAPKLDPCEFDVGPYSVVSCWDLFELGASPSPDDWRRALSSDAVSQFLCHAQPDLRHFEKEQRAEQHTFQIIKKYQLYCLSEHMNKYCNQSVFGSSMEWKKIKNGFTKKCNKSILNSIDLYTYYLNPKVDNLASILSDTANSSGVASKRKIICEPILWLIYVGYYLLDRQQKLQELVFSSYHYQDNSTKVKGQKLKTMIDNLAKQAKDESERLRKLMAKLPSQEDLQKTFETEINERDPKQRNIYTKSFKKEFVVSTNKSMTEISKTKR